MSKLINYLRLPLLAILALIFVYTGTSIAKSKNQTESTQNNLEERIAFLEKNIKENQELNESKISGLQEELKNYAGQVEFYKSLSSHPKEVATDSAKTEIQYVEKIVPKTVVQTVTSEVEKNQATITVENLGSYKIDLKDSDNAFTILLRAADENGFSVEYQEYSFGVFITAIGGIKPSGNQFWAFYYNGQLSNVGASAQKISKDDATFWRLESF